MIRLILAIFIACLSALPIAAQEYPALHDVMGVAGNDVLNIRSAPSASSAIVGSLGPYQTGVEIVASDRTGKWGLVNANDTSGWISLRYMNRAQQGYWLDLTHSLSCSGTEPFWSLSLGGNRALFGRNGQSTTYSLLAKTRSANNPTKAGFTAVTSTVNPSSISGFIAAQSCSDGMSDRQYGITLDLMLQKNAGMTLLTGCCTLQR